MLGSLYEQVNDSTAAIKEYEHSLAQFPQTTHSDYYKSRLDLLKKK